MSPDPESNQAKSDTADPTASGLTEDEIVTRALATWNKQTATARMHSPNDPTYSSATQSAEEFRTRLRETPSLERAIKAGQQMTLSTVIVSGTAIGHHQLHYWDIEHNNDLSSNYAEIRKALDDPCRVQIVTGREETKVTEVLKCHLGLQSSDAILIDLNQRKKRNERTDTISTDESDGRPAVVITTILQRV